MLFLWQIVPQPQKACASCSNGITRKRCFSLISKAKILENAFFHPIYIHDEAEFEKVRSTRTPLYITWV
jgi:hypothetical protein